MKVVVLSNNHSACDLSAEWGLSLYVEYNGKKILIDSGLGKLFLEKGKGKHTFVGDVLTFK